MRKFMALLPVFLLCGLFSFAQQKTISGRVISSDGSPLEGITVQVRGTSTATATNDEGNFNLTVPNNSTLVFSGVGFQVQEYKVGADNNITVVMQSAAQTLEQVVVTALGIERTKNSLPYAAQSIAITLVKPGPIMLFLLCQVKFRVLKLNKEMVSVVPPTY